jgi:hypothetical protein
MPSPLSYLLTDLTGGSGYGQVTIPAQPENTHRMEARGVDRQASRYMEPYGPMKARHGPPLGHGEAWGGAGTSPNWSARNSGTALAPNNAQVSRTFPGRG